MENERLGLHSLMSKSKSEALLANGFGDIKEKIGPGRSLMPNTALLLRTKNLMEPLYLSFAKGPWKAILKHHNLIHARMTSKTEDVANTSFWSDVLLMDDILARNFLFTI